MEYSSGKMFWLFGLFIMLVFIVGIYCLIVTSNLIRSLIGLEIMTKAVTLFLALGGYLTKNTGLAQSFMITLITIEVVIVIVAGGFIITAFKKYGTIDINKLRNLKG